MRRLFRWLKDKGVTAVITAERGREQQREKFADESADIRELPTSTHSRVDVETDELRRGELLKAWVAAEEVAMHFNTLLSGFRLKAIGGIAVGAVVGVGLKLGVGAPGKDFGGPWTVFSVFLALTLIWTVILVADFSYYYRLLAGAVDELLRLEKRLGNVLLSHCIEVRVQGQFGKLSSVARAKNGPSWGIRAFYYMPLAPLESVTVWLCPAFGLVSA